MSEQGLRMWLARSFSPLNSTLSQIGRSLRPRPQYYMGLRIAGDNLVLWRFDNVEINYLNLSLTYILKQISSLTF